MQISKKIALIELQAHAEVFFHFAKLLNGTANLLLLTTSDIYQDAPVELTSNAKNQWIVIKDNESDTTFLNKNIPVLNACQQTLFITIVRDFGFYANLKIDSKKMLIIHNSLAMLQPIRAIRVPFSWSLDWGLDLLRVIKCFLFLEFWHKRRLVKSFDLLIFPSEIIENYMRSRVGYLRALKTTSVEFSFHEPALVKKSIRSIEETIITIPGTITNEGRDYEMVIAAFQRLIPRLTKPVKLILAGRPKGKYGQVVIQQLEALSTEYFKLIYFKNHIAQTEYDALLAASHFLILPLNKHVKYSIYQEINGKTKITGSVNDMIRFGLPALISGEYPLSETVEKLVGGYSNSQGLSTQLLEWITAKTYKNYFIQNDKFQLEYAKNPQKQTLIQKIC